MYYYEIPKKYQLLNFIRNKKFKSHKIIDLIFRFD